ncbi:MAG: 50S ribosomal protein L13 [Bdellovibrionales bacterium]|nr:50S ribosomal protein L13 [Bdellovibrionales bacterium]
MKTWMAKKEEADSLRDWYVVDATDKTLGRLATEVANVLRGKRKPTFTPHVDTGDFVVVVNSDKIKMSGNKWDAKRYYRHTGFFGSLKEMTAREMLEKDSTQIIKNAVQHMLPKNRLSYRVINKLKIYKTAEHPHAAQKPQALNIN